MNHITRTITLDDITPDETAMLFAKYNSEGQARFFHALHDIVEKWGGMGWCGQCSWIADDITPEGRKVIAKLNEWCGDGGPITQVQS